MSDENSHKKKREVPENYCVTKLENTSTSIEWTIEDFDLVSFKPNQFLESAKFLSVNGKKSGCWKLRLFSTSSTEKWIALYIVRDDSWEDIFMECQVCIVDAGGNETNKKEFMQKMSNVTMGFPEFIKRNELVDDLLPNGDLILRCYLTIINIKSSLQTVFKDPNDGSLSPSDAFQRDFSNLLQEELFSDVVLVCDGRKFPVHKNILSARSSMFRAMFTHQFKEKESHEVEIKELTPDVLENVLCYMYTGQLLDSPTSDIAISLLQAADLYNLLELKDLCVKYLKNNLSSMNVCKVAIVANLHGLSELTESCVDFICTRGHELSQTSDDFFSRVPSCISHIILKKIFQSSFRNNSGLF